MNCVTFMLTSLPNLTLNGGLNWGIPPEYCSLISVWSRVIICDFTYGDMVGCQGPLHGSVGSTMTRESLNRGIHIEIMCVGAIVSIASDFHWQLFGWLAW